ncbi:transcriptional regulator, TraR/DksA family [Citreimonas salinaria]|uniref:Transcriptional regulator, TraR/DksA family n=2 Tax=Citreimonas salinaria TaxID=321339 RepID=A0A1H3LAT3_9RHOB|nr:TraR/DksA family transcriptional regulator [Citreimonas salinaria]SDY61279.1 transcriptional regulator, TraR/DksA family [Citreimonas salinaria]
MNIANREAALRERREELVRHLAAVEHTLDEPLPKDWEDRSSERQGDEVLEALGQTELAEIRQFDAALGRIRAGTYGMCQSCGETIAPARLDVLPATPFCANCAP